MIEDVNPRMVKSAVEGQMSNDLMKHRKLPNCETVNLRRGRNECNASKANGTNAIDLRSGWQRAQSYLHEAELRRYLTECAQGVGGWVF